MRTIIFLLLSLLPGLAFSQLGSKAGIIISVKNPDQKIGGSEELVEVSWSSLLTKDKSLKEGNFKVQDLSTGMEVPYQLLSRGTEQIQHLLMQVVVAPGKTKQFKLIPGKPKEFVSRVYGRYVPERKDDFAWENDRVAFRMYGKALESTKENALGIDVWSKRTSNMIIDKWYKTGDYHADHGDGLDYYSVGNTLGGGDIAPYLNGKVVFPKNYRKWKILDNGPLRFSFELEYEAWEVGNKKVSVSKRISLDAGSQLNKVEATFIFIGDTSSLSAAIGIVKRKEPGIISLYESEGIAGYWEPQHGADGTLGLATILKRNIGKMLLTDDHVLTLTPIQNGRPIVYYNGAAWSKGGYIATSEEWLNYLNNFNKRLKNPLIVTLK